MIAPGPSRPSRRHWLAVLAAALAAAAAPARLAAQDAVSTGGAGITSGDGQAASQMDTGFQSKSAIGQLEELTGQTVDRGSTTTTIVIRRQAPPPQAPAPLSPSQSFSNAVTMGAAQALVGGLFANAFNLGGNDDAAAQEAAYEQQQAAAQAEAQRQQAIKAGRDLRDQWDQTDAEMGASIAESLGGTGTAPAAGAATDFFGSGNASVSLDAPDLPSDGAASGQVGFSVPEAPPPSGEPELPSKPVTELVADRGVEQTNDALELRMSDLLEGRSEFEAEQRALSEQAPAAFRGVEETEARKIVTENLDSIAAVEIGAYDMGAATRQNGSLGAVFSGLESAVTNLGAGVGDRAKLALTGGRMYGNYADRVMAGFVDQVNAFMKDMGAGPVTGESGEETVERLKSGTDSQSRMASILLGGG